MNSKVCVIGKRKKNRLIKNEERYFTKNMSKTCHNHIKVEWKDVAKILDGAGYNG